MLNPGGRLHGACAAYLIDRCVVVLDAGCTLALTKETSAAALHLFLSPQVAAVE